MSVHTGEPPRLRALRGQDLSQRRGAEGGSPSGPPPGGRADVCKTVHAELELPDTGLTTRYLSRGYEPPRTEDRALRVGAGLVLIGLGCLAIFAGAVMIADARDNAAAAARDAAAARESCGGDRSRR